MVHQVTDRKVVTTQAEYDAALADGWCASRADLSKTPVPTLESDVPEIVDQPKKRGRPRKV